MATIESVTAPMISSAEAPEALAGSIESFKSHCAHVSTPPRTGVPAAAAAPPAAAGGAVGLAALVGCAAWPLVPTTGGALVGAGAAVAVVVARDGPQAIVASPALATSAA